MRDPLYHIRVMSADILIKCHHTNCEREIVGLHKSDRYEQLGEVIAQIEIDNGWEDGLCEEHHLAADWDEFQ